MSPVLLHFLVKFVLDEAAEVDVVLAYPFCLIVTYGDGFLYHARSYIPYVEAHIAVAVLVFNFSCDGC